MRSLTLESMDAGNYGNISYSFNCLPKAAVADAPLDCAASTIPIFGSDDVDIS